MNRGNGQRLSCYGECLCVCVGVCLGLRVCVCVCVCVFVRLCLRVWCVCVSVYYTWKLVCVRLIFADDGVLMTPFFADI